MRNEGENQTLLPRYRTTINDLFPTVLSPRVYLILLSFLPGRIEMKSMKNNRRYVSYSLPVVEQSGTSRALLVPRRAKDSTFIVGKFRGNGSCVPLTCRRKSTEITSWSIIERESAILAREGEKVGGRRKYNTTFPNREGCPRCSRLFHCARSRSIS